MEAQTSTLTPPALPEERLFEILFIDHVYSTRPMFGFRVDAAGDGAVRITSTPEEDGSLKVDRTFTPAPGELKNVVHTLFHEVWDACSAWSDGPGAADRPFTLTCSGRHLASGIVQVCQMHTDPKDRRTTVDVVPFKSELGGRYIFDAREMGAAGDLADRSCHYILGDVFGLPTGVVPPNIGARDAMANLTGLPPEVVDVIRTIQAMAPEAEVTVGVRDDLASLLAFLATNGDDTPDDDTIN